MANDYLDSVKKQFEYYKMLGEKTILQLPDEKLFWQFNEESNSIAMIINHLCGNILSRWTDFKNADGEKEWRNRDVEFEKHLCTKSDLMNQWQQGWQCLFEALNDLTENDLDKIIYIRNMGHTITEAINRQLAHYPYHIGQIVFIGKMICGKNWSSLSIPKGHSKVYNNDKFAKPKRKLHFTDDFLNKSK